MLGLLTGRISLACSSFDGEPAATAGPDAGGGASDASDATTTPDAAVTPPDAEPPRFCATHVPAPGFKVVYCSDFDDGAAGQRVDGSAGADAEIVYDTDRFVSSPSSAHVSLEKSTSGATVDVALPPTAVHLLVQYDLYLNPSSDKDPTIALVRAGRCDYYIFAGADPSPGAKMRAQEHRPDGGMDDLARFDSALTRSAWHHIVLDFDLASGQIALSNDATKNLPANSTMLAECRNKEPDSVRVGIPFSGMATPHHAWFDNVVVEVK